MIDSRLGNTLQSEPGKLGRNDCCVAAASSDCKKARLPNEGLIDIRDANEDHRSSGAAASMSLKQPSAEHTHSGRRGRPNLKTTVDGKMENRFGG
jgi:hypothetical protein